MTRSLRTLAFVLGTGFVLFAISERLFWSFWRSGDDLGAMVGGWLIYSLFGYITLSAGRLFRARGFSAWLMLGALFGWIDEGVYAMTLYGDPSMPFPFTIAWTGLAWHALLSVGVGLAALRRCLAAPSFWSPLALGLLIAGFWGLWASGWNDETPPVRTEPMAFFWHALVVVIGLVAAELTISLGDAGRFTPSKIGLGAAIGVVMLFFALITTPAIPWAPLVLLPLFALVVWALRKVRDTSGRADAVDELGRPIRMQNLLGLAPIPPVATVIYAGLSTLGTPFPVHLIVAGLASLIGTAAFAVALFRLRHSPVTGVAPLATPQHR